MAQTRTVGLFLNDTSSFNGYTLISPSIQSTTYLLNNCGRVVNSWMSPINFSLSAYLLEDGDLVRISRVTSTVFNQGGIGGAIQRFDWDGTMKWSYILANDSIHQHHDIEPMPNGNFLVVAWEYRTAAEALANGRNPLALNGRLWPTLILEIEPAGSNGGNIVWEWRAWDHLVQDFDDTKLNYGVVADHPELINFNYVDGAPFSSDPDWIHVNSIDYNPNMDQILLSAHNFDEIWIIDHSTTTVEAAGHSGGNSGKGGDLLYRWGNPYAYGRATAADKVFFGQHDANWIDEGLQDGGMIMVYNNGRGRPEGNFSTVEVIQPPLDSLGNYTIQPDSAFGPEVPHWRYPGVGFDTSFYSERISGAHRLPYGHTLICEGLDGRVFEVDYSGNIVWDYINPIGTFGAVQQGATPTNNGLFRALRYAPNYKGLAGRQLSPDTLLELNPIPDSCLIVVDPAYIDTTLQVNVGAALESDRLKILVYPTPANAVVHLDLGSAVGYELAIYSVSGKRYEFMSKIGAHVALDVSAYPVGLYVGFVHALGRRPSRFRFVVQ